MVVMQVRDEHRVDSCRHLGGRAVAAQMRHPAAQNRIGEKPRAANLDEDGRVADVGDPGRGNAPSLRPAEADRITPRG